MEGCFQKSSIRVSLWYMNIVSEYTMLETDMQESNIVSNLMIDFPPITKQDNQKVLTSYVMLHFEQIGDIINDNSIPPN